MTWIWCYVSELWKKTSTGMITESVDWGAHPTVHLLQPIARRNVKLGREALKIATQLPSVSKPA